MDAGNPTRAVTLSGEAIRSLPTVRSYNALLVLVPGVVTSVNDSVTGRRHFVPDPRRTHQRGRLLLDGLTVGSPPSGNSATSYSSTSGRAQEVTFTAAAGSARPKRPVS